MPSLFGANYDRNRLTSLPVLFDDETIYSWCGTVHGACPSPSALETSRRLFGTPYAALTHDFPSHLERLQSVLGVESDLLDDLALRHTLLGYFLVARPAHVCLRILTDCRQGAVSSLKFRLGITASRIGGSHPLKGCRQCFDAQENRVCRAYWRVQHQAPLVLYCEEHDELLDVVLDHTTPVHRRGWILPRSGLPRQWRRPTQPSSRAREHLRRLTVFSRGWSNLRPAALNPERLAQTYRNGLRQLDLLTAGESVRSAEAVRLISQHFCELVQFDELCWLRNEVGWANLIGNLSRAVPRPSHPAKHVLLATALFQSWAQFMAAYDASGQAIHRPIQRPDRASESADEQRTFEHLVKLEGLSVSAAGRRIGITATTAVRWAKILGLTYTPRPKIHTLDRLEAIRERLLRGEAKSAIAKDLGISAVIVDRVVSSEPAVASVWREARRETARTAYRRHFAELVAAMQGATIKQIRAAQGSGYAWLYRHDRQWLAGIMPFFSQVPLPGDEDVQSS